MSVGESREYGEARGATRLARGTLSNGAEGGRQVGGARLSNMVVHTVAVPLGTIFDGGTRSRNRGAPRAA